MGLLHYHSFLCFWCQQWFFGERVGYKESSFSVARLIVVVDMCLASHLVPRRGRDVLSRLLVLAGC